MESKSKNKRLGLSSGIKNILFFVGIGLMVSHSHAQQTYALGNAQTGKLLGSNGLCFIPNKGQVADMNGNLCPDILYKGESRGADIYLRKSGISYVYNNMGEVQYKVHEKVEALINAGTLTEADEDTKQDELMRDEKIKVNRVDMDFAGANANCRFVNEDEIEGYNNYYYAHCPNGVLNVKQYNKVTYKNIYDGIDITYYGNKQNACLTDRQGIKYDLVVQPHANPNQIKLRWSGAESIHINREGSLVIKTSVNEFTESIPRVYQNINGKIVDVKANYNLTLSLPGRAGEGLVTFELGTWNPEHALVVDPWVTYYGGTGGDAGTSIATDASGNVYLGGWTSSVASISSAGFQNVKSGGADAFLVKFNGAGARLWATYYGGTGSDQGKSVAADALGNIYLAGQTTSTTGIASAGFQNIFGGTFDAFLVKFNSVSGTRLWATYYGGMSGDYGQSIATDALGNVYLAGYTVSTAGIASTGFQNIFGGGTFDAFLVKFSGAGSRVWGTYYGGTGDDMGKSVATDASGNVYLAGNTPSTAGIASGGFQNVLGGGTDAFLVKFNSTSGGRLWATYYGGTAYDGGNSVATDVAGNVYMAGQTTSAIGIAAGGFQNVFGGSVFYDAFLVKFDSAGGAASRIWATYLGGSDRDYALSVAVDQLTNDVYVSGDTYSLNFPVSSCAWQQTLGGEEDGFVTHFSQAGQLICSSYVGSPAIPHDEECVITLYGCFVYMTGYVGGSYPVTPAAHQTVYGGGTSDAFVAQLYKNSCGFDKTTALVASTSTNPLCNNTPINFTGNFSISCDNSVVSYTWSFPGGTPAASVNQNPTGIVYTTPGNYTVQLKAKTTCDSSSKSINITISPCTVCNLIGQFAKGAAGCTACGCKEWILVTATGGTGPYTYLWPDGSARRYKNQLCPGAYTINIKDKNGCSINIDLAVP
ncbi:MAG: SBBP repeat-containing protein [Bacteroidetes bacterium]|nr:SBBP repeat-containing protein [Bacteroidota bacterium]